MKPFKHPLNDRLRYLFGDATLPTRLNTLGSVLSGKASLPKVITKPWILQLEVTNRCNLNCIMCSRSSTQMTLGDMAPELIDDCVELSRHTQETALFGYGEPLLSKAFFILLERLKSSRIGFFTNGLTLNDNMMTKILETSASPLSYVVISMDGATPETYHRIRPGSSFDKVWSNIRNAVSRREKESLKHIIRLEFVAMASNIHELPELVKMADEAGVDGIKVSHLVVWEEALRKESLLHYPKHERIFAQAKEEADKRRLYLDLPKILRPEASRNPGEPYPSCKAPWQYVMVSFEGDIRACCFAPELTMGKLQETSFASIWSSERYRALRRKMNTATPPGPCLRCEERFRYFTSPNEEATYIKLQPRKK